MTAKLKYLMYAALLHGSSMGCLHVINVIAYFRLVHVVHRFCIFGHSLLDLVLLAILLFQKEYWHTCIASTVTKLSNSKACACACTRRAEASGPEQTALDSSAW